MPTFLARVAAACLFATGFSPDYAVAQEQAGATNQGQQEIYRVHPGDEIEIYVWGEDRLQRTVKVLPDGTLAFPLVGQLDAGDRTLKEIEGIVTSALAPEYRGEVPRVTASVVSSAGMQFSVMGRVNAPGAFTPNRRVNVLEALAMAGGPSEFADLNDVLILRKRDTSLVHYKVSVARLFKSNVSQTDIERANILEIEPGDTIIVP